MYASSADLTGVIGASRVSGHARKRAILVRIPSLGGRLGTGRGGEGAFRRSRPLFRPLVRGKLISFIRGGDEGREREREEKGGGNQFLLASAWFGEILFRARSAERLSLPRKYGGKGSKQKNGLVLSSISNPPSPSPSRSRLARPEFVPPTPPYLQPPPPKDRPFRSLDANISAKMGTPLSDPMVDK